MMKKTLVVIVSYNAMQWVERCLSSLQGSSTPVDVLMVDNGSTDGTREFVKERFPKTTLMEMSENLGFAGGNNLGFKHAIDQNYDFVFLLNQDTWVLEDTVSKLVGTLESDPMQAITSPVQLTGDGQGLDRNFSTYISANSLEDLREIGGTEQVDFVNAAAWLMPVSVVKKVGGFDPIFPHYGEDRDYCNRLTFHGFKIQVVLDSFIHHDREYSSSNPFRKRYNLVLTMSLAHVKNINHTLAENNTSWRKWRARKKLRMMLMFDREGLKVEKDVVRTLDEMKGQIIEAREQSEQLNGPFLS